MEEHNWHNSSQLGFVDYITVAEIEPHQFKSFSPFNIMVLHTKIDFLHSSWKFNKMIATHPRASRAFT